MLYYIALLWNASDPAKRHAAAQLLTRFRRHAPDWTVTVESDGMTVLHRLLGPQLNQAYPLPDGRGVVLGKLFRKAGAAAAAHMEDSVFDTRSSASIVATAGKHLIENYWGQYVAFLHDRDSRRHWVLRDPTGLLPCQHNQLHGVDIYFMRLEDRDRLLPLPVSLNRHYLLGYLLHDSACVRETGIESVETILAGECIEHDGDRRASCFHWNPLALAERDVIEDPAEAVAAMRQKVLDCVHSWASCFDRILLRLSGGLDSSIVLASLACAPIRPRVISVNNYCLGSASADERHFARLAARRAGCELVEWESSTDFRFEEVRDIPRTVSPYPCVANPRALQREMRFLRRMRIAAAFNGVSGDEVFYSGGPIPASTDYGWRHPSSLRLCSYAIDDAVLMRCSFWSILRTAIRHGSLRRPWTLQGHIPRDYRPLMPREIRDEAGQSEDFWHPLYRGAATIPPAKFCQSYSFTLSAARIHIPNSYEQFMLEVSPLFSQPLLELALRIPTYVLRTGGQDRAIARRAFADSVPDAIIRRSSKGTDAEYVHALVAKNAALLRELLSGGYLVQQGLLDGAAVDEVLSGRPTRNRSYALEILDYFNVEVWARSLLDSASCSRQEQLAEYDSPY